MDLLAATLATLPYLWSPFYFLASLRVHFLFPLTGWWARDGLLVVLVQAGEWGWSLSWQLWVVILALSSSCSPTWCPPSVLNPVQAAFLPPKKQRHTLLPTSYQRAAQNSHTVQAIRRLYTLCRMGVPTTSLDDWGEVGLGSILRVAFPLL